MDRWLQAAQDANAQPMLTMADQKDLQMRHQEDQREIKRLQQTLRRKDKAERFIQTLCKEWAYAMPFQNSQERNAWLPRYLSIYNQIRRQSALGGQSPQQRLKQLLC